MAGGLQQREPAATGSLLLLPDNPGGHSWSFWAAAKGLAGKVRVAEVGEGGRAVVAATTTTTARAGGSKKSSWVLWPSAEVALRSGELGEVAGEGGFQGPEQAAANAAIVFIGKDADPAKGGGVGRAVVAAGLSAEVAWERLKAGVREDGGVTARDGQLWVITVEGSSRLLRSSSSKKEEEEEEAAPAPAPAPFPSDAEVQDWAGRTRGLAHVVDLHPWAATMRVFRRTVRPGDKVFVINGQVWRQELEE